MTNREIEERLQRAVAQETPDVLQQVLSACGDTGRTIDMTEKLAQTKKRWAPWAAGVAAALVIAVGGSFGFNYVYGVDSIIAIDVNPSVELKTSRSERVLSATALNDDANTILDGMDLKGVQLDVAVNALIGSMIKNGYIDEACNSILVSVENADAARREQIQNETAASINEALTQYTISGAVLNQPMTEDESIKTLANENNISLGRASLIQKLMALDPTLTVEQLVPLNINDLSLLLLAKEPGSVNVAYGQVSDSAYIGSERAAQIALERAPAGSTLWEVGFDLEDGRACYEGTLRNGNVEYDFEVDALTGEFIKWEEDREYDLPILTGEDIGEQKAREIAQARAPGATLSWIRKDVENGRVVYDGTLHENTKKYEFEIDSVSGEFVKWEEKVISQTSSSLPAGGSISPENTISEDEVRNLVLARVPDGTITKMVLEYDDGRTVYEGELYKGAVEYEFEIDAATGQFLSWEEDDRTGLPAITGSTSGSSTVSIDEQKARELALERVPGGTVTWIQLEYERGRTLYEGKLLKDQVEYEFEIDAATGQFVKWEEETHVGLSSSSVSASIDESAARELALARVPGGTIGWIKLDYDDGRARYEGVVIKDQVEYEFEIDANNSQFLKWEEETHGNVSQPSAPSSGDMISEEQARSLALGRAPEGSTLIKIKLDRDDGRTLYEGELRNGFIEYEFEIDAYSGDFVKWEEDYND